MTIKDKRILHIKGKTGLNSGQIAIDSDHSKRIVYKDHNGDMQECLRVADRTITYDAGVTDAANYANFKAAYAKALLLSPTAGDPVLIEVQAVSHDMGGETFTISTDGIKLVGITNAFYSGIEDDNFIDAKSIFVNGVFSLHERGNQTHFKNIEIPKIVCDSPIDSNDIANFVNCKIVDVDSSGALLLIFKNSYIRDCTDKNFNCVDCKVLKFEGGVFDRCYIIATGVDKPMPQCTVRNSVVEFFNVCLTETDSTLYKRFFDNCTIKLETEPETLKVTNFTNCTFELTSAKLKLSYGSNLISCTVGNNVYVGNSVGINILNNYLRGSVRKDTGYAGRFSLNGNKVDGFIESGLDYTGSNNYTQDELKFKDKHLAEHIPLSETGETALNTTKQSLVGAINEVQIPADFYQKYVNHQGDPSGMINGGDYTFDFNSSTRTFSVNNGEDPIVFFSGKKYYSRQFTESLDTVVLPASSEGMNLIYYDATGQLKIVKSTVFWLKNIVLNYAFVAAVYWDEDNDEIIYNGCEIRHGASMSGVDHLYLHMTRGFALESGGQITDIISDGDGSLASHCQCGVELTKAWDEDAYFDAIQKAKLWNANIYYRDGANWRLYDDESYFVRYTAGSRAQYNHIDSGTGNGSQVEVPNKDFVLAHVLATNDLVRSVVIVQGQQTYTTARKARNGAYVEAQSLVMSGLPFQEFKFLGSIIFKTSDAYTNTPKTKVIATDDGKDYVDLRNSGIGVGGDAVPPHNGLSGLNESDFMHLTADEYAQLTDGGATTLHTHSAIGNAIALRSVEIEDTIPAGTDIKDYILKGTYLQNFVKYSEDISQSTWFKGKIDHIDGVGGIVADSDNSEHKVYQSYLFTGTETYTFTAKIKKGDKDWAILAFYDGSTFYYAYFNVVTGTVGTVDSIISNAVIEDVGSNYYLCKIDFTITSTILYTYIQPATSDGVKLFAGDGSTVNTYVYSAQLRNRTIAQNLPYVKTLATAETGKQIFRPVPEYDDVLIVEQATATITANYKTVIVKYTATGDVTLTIATKAIENPDFKVNIVDAGGNAATHNITIATEGSQTINGQANAQIVTDYGHLEMVTDTNNLFII